MIRIKNHIQRRMSDARGFTLLEALISLAVFSIGILGMIVMQTTAVKSNTLAESVSENTTFALSEIEELMAADYLDDRINDSTVTYTTNKDGGKYRVAADNLPDDAIPGAKRITVRSQFGPVENPQTIELNIFKPRVIE